MKEVVTMRQLLEAGVHFGHQTKRWNPKMKPYIFTSRNGIHVIDLQQTIKLIKKVYSYVRETVKHNGTVLFVGTKKQAQDAIVAEADRCKMPYINHRWLGGTLTNNITLRQSINKLKKFTREKEDGTFDSLSNKESSKKQKTLTRLSYYLDGIKNMVALPSIIFIVDTKKEQLAVKEAERMGIPIVGIVDTNADPTEVQFPIPANDDAIRAIKLICSVIAQASIDGQQDAVDMANAHKASQEKIKKEQEDAAAAKKAGEVAPKVEAEKVATPVKAKEVKAATPVKEVKKEDEKPSKSATEKEKPAKKVVKAKVEKEATDVKKETPKKAPVKKAPKAKKTEDKTEAKASSKAAKE
ncbi:30S ribosomal protein S2 [bacterium]|jgi:small subunit ribosomal protein S2|nr:30S ribosomal protein S2 [bacterium]